MNQMLNEEEIILKKKILEIVEEYLNNNEKIIEAEVVTSILRMVKEEYDI